jgi:hypothetical protein
MGIEKIGAIALDRDKLTANFGELRPGTSAAVSDISIANQISVGPYLPAERMGEPGNLASLKPGKPFATVAGLRHIAGSANRWMA